MSNLNRFNRHHLRFIPLGIATGCVSLVFFSKTTGVGPGLLFFGIAYVLLPVTNLFAIALNEKFGRLWAGISSIVCYLFLTAYSLIPGREYPHARPDGEQMMGAIYLAMFAATFFASVMGWIGDNFRKSR
jgi:hypothetical protein